MSKRRECIECEAELYDSEDEICDDCADDIESAAAARDQERNDALDAEFGDEDDIEACEDCGIELQSFELDDGRCASCQHEHLDEEDEDE